MNRFLLVVVSACALLAVSSAFGQDSPDPKALVEQAGKFLEKQEKFSFDAGISMQITSPKVEEYAYNIQVTVARPNRLAMVFADASLYSNGKELVTYYKDYNKYVVESAPESFGTISETEGGKIFTGANGLLIDVISSNSAERLLSNVAAAKYVGREKIEGKEYHRCRFEQEQFDWDIWIAASGDPEILQIVPDMSKQLAKLPEEMRKDFKMEMLLKFSNWNFSPAIEDALFTFTPPADAEKVESFFEEQAEEGPHPLLGKVAPPFQLQNLEGKPVDLARHAGKQVVILDFWATWCGPCIAAMPEVKAAAEKFADKGVVIYFVNLQEDAETIGAFLKEQNLDLPVALDTEGAVAAEYGVSGIPQTVIIGKDGKVQVVHVGFNDNLQKQLTAELEGILAGRDLATEELAKHEKKAEGEAETPEETEP